MSGLKGVPKRVTVTADLAAYPKEFVSNAELIIHDGMVIKNRYGTENRFPVQHEILSCKIVRPEEAESLVRESGLVYELDDDDAAADSEPRERVAGLGTGLIAEEVDKALNHLIHARDVVRERTTGSVRDVEVSHGIRKAIIAVRQIGEPDLESAGDGNDKRPPDEFDCVAAACEQLHHRLTEGPGVNPAELARVIDILSFGAKR